MYYEPLYRAFAPYPPNSRPDFLLEAFDQFTVGIDKGLLSFDLFDDFLLIFDRWKWNLCLIEFRQR